MGRVGIALYLVLIAVQASADAAVPSPDVTTRVIIRESASSQSAQIGVSFLVSNCELTFSLIGASATSLNERCHAPIGIAGKRTMVVGRNRPVGVLAGNHKHTSVIAPHDPDDARL